MYREGDTLKFSPADLIAFLETEFGSWMDRWYIERKAGRLHLFGNGSEPTKDLLSIIETCTPDEEDEQARLIKDQGLAYERAFLQRLKEQGRRVVEIERREGALEQTWQAMQQGAQLIYQGYLGLDDFGGYADFLARQDGSSALGDHHYEVWEIKLARSAKPYFIIQLCAYAEMLEKLQGKRPLSIEVILGNGECRRFSTNSFFYYYQALKRAFIRFHQSFNLAQMPHPGLCSSYGQWNRSAEQMLAKTDHVCRVARITRGQIKRLQVAGITTMTDLAASLLPHVRGIPPAVLDRLKTQANLQIASQGLERPRFEIIPADPDNPRRGLALLPPASPMDVFFDMEGYPLIDGGLEYLFGAVHLEDGEPRFIDWWAHHSVAERAAFEAFIDWVFARWTRDPTLHIYHYAAYEVTAMRRLMGKYATREDRVDELLRNQVFVDLYTVVRQSLLIGTSGYSLKDIEYLYMPKRQGKITTASDSIVAYQRWLEHQDSAILEEIRGYNQLDCESLLGLAEWLRGVQITAGAPYIREAKAKDEDGGDKDSDDTVNLTKALAERLLRQVADGQVEDLERRRIQELLAWLLEFHWRETKPVFWRMFDRHEMTEAELSDDLDCLGGLRRTTKPRAQLKKSWVYEYRFDPDQDTKLSAGSKCFFAHDLAVNTTIETIHPDEGSVFIKLGPTAPQPPERLNLIPNEHVRVGVLSAGVQRYVAAWSQGQILSPAVDDFLHRRPPRMAGHASGPLVPEGHELLPAVTDLIKRLSNSTLCVQGPPGTGKTFTAAAAILALLRDGRRVGVMAHSHKAILNLMKAVQEAASQQGFEARLFKVGDNDDDPLIRRGAIRRIKSNEAAAVIHEAGVLLGGTAWVFSREELEGKFDYLFVDEAGQVSVANLVAAGPSAGNLVLVGDQMQLAQPIQGSHPGESGTSALEYLLNGRATIPPDFGIFLNTTRRIHPDICDFISVAVYEGRLRAHPDTANQVIVCPAGGTGILRRQSGIIFVPVSHEGNSQASDEEVEVIDRIVKELLGRQVFGRAGKAPRALTMADILLVAPYNMQVRRLQSNLGPAARVGSVDKFQGQEAPVVIVSMCASSLEDCPRGADFLLSRNRINVAISRAQSLAIVVGSPALMSARCQTIEEMELVNLYCWLAAYANALPV